MQEKLDWYPGTLAGQREMYGNVLVKIDNYKTQFNLDGAFLDKVKLICQSFIEAHDKIEQNRATNRQATVWFDALMHGVPRGEPISKTPVYLPLNMPAGAFIGMEKEFRELMGFFKANPVYTDADGEDLMIVARETNAPDMAVTAPDLKVSVSPGGVVTIGWRKTGFDTLEVQYRKAGTGMWQHADKSTEKEIEFAPPLTTPGEPEKFEFRGVYILKNQRVGNWSPIYTVTVG